MTAKEELKKLKEEFFQLNTEEELEGFRGKISAYIKGKNESEMEEFVQQFTKEASEAVERADAVYNYVSIRIKLEPILDVVSLSYIAEKYFKKSRSWLSQRLNENFVNGHLTTFTNEELKTLSDALNDIADKIKNTARSIA
ncbi:MAG: DUF5053 domain-containing protein [Tannerellaceae bacterium]|nr:DUF5053 domain-containing protein [Tannerellaceae bacterium]